MTRQTPPTPEIEVRPGESPGAYCPHCDRPFDTERSRDLHVGAAHEEDATPDERAAYEAAREAEHDELWLFHAKVVGALGAIYAVTVILYLVAIQSGFL